MTEYVFDGPRPEVGKYSGFTYIELFVSNAKQAADWYKLRFGFDRVAYRGLETGSREVCSHVLKQNDIFIVLTSPLNPVDNDLSKNIMISGDAVKDVAFSVDDVRGVYKKAIERGAKSVKEPEELKDEHGSVVVATIQTYGNVQHTFVNKENYKGVFLPGYKAVDDQDPVAKLLGVNPGLGFIDHVVGNQPDNKMVEAADWYEKCLDFHRFWSVDDKQVHTKFSALRSIVMTDFDQTIKMPINEPADGLRKSQIQEYVEYHGGAGVQHVALNTPDIITAIKNMRARGVDFLKVPSSYYVDLRKRLAASLVKVNEDLDIIEKLNILIDFDDQGYLLQLFTRPVEDRPTLFYEVIQRNNHSGFGAGNFKSLFEAIEREQQERGNL